MNKEEPTSSTPNETVPHLTEAEIAAVRQMQKQNNVMQNHAEFCYFRKMVRKPKKFNQPKTFNEKGEIVVCEGRPAPVSKGNLGKGTLRNKKCSCGSGKKFKKCCLNRNSN
jgi:uncharacterized protein YecA (UPF0149 family)